MLNAVRSQHIERLKRGIADHQNTKSLAAIISYATDDLNGVEQIQIAEFVIKLLKNSMKGGDLC